LVSKIIERFDDIAARVENFYTSKLVPKGKTLGNYDALVADIQSKKTAVNAALTKAQSDINGFSCTADDPKGLLRQYRLDMQAVKGALQDYRKSIKNLIVAVRGLVGASETATPTMSPGPTATP
jgi:hypothetical protein